MPKTTNDETPEFADPEPEVAEDAVEVDPEVATEPEPEVVRPTGKTYRALLTDQFHIGTRVKPYVLVQGEEVEIEDPNAAAILLENGHIEAA